ncbi:MAG TPA: LysR family transcriptional regulator [Thermodesulfobacteriota bacterium]|nr:LysR family transcriptional regulator [Thermodesulfobacteriota bacterium]
MNLRQLEVFYLVVKKGSCTRAAEELNVTQPAVTIQVKSLEKSVNLKLIQHFGEKIQLSEAGELLYQFAEKIFDLVSEADEKMRDFKRLMRGTLQIGTTKNYARYIMPSLLTTFQARFPDIRVVLDEGNSEDMARSVLDMKNELAFICQINIDRRLKSIFFSAEEFVLVASPQHGFSQKGTISFKELNGEPVILREKGSGSRAAIVRRFDLYGIRPSVIIEAGSLDFIVRYVKQGKGISFMFEPDIKEELEKGLLKVIPIEEGNVSFFTDIVYHAEQPLSPPAQAFLRIVEELKGQLRGELRSNLSPPSSVLQTN